MTTRETSTGGQARKFQSTLWEDIRLAQSGNSEALERLMADYWKPIYFFVRRKGHGVEDAKDLTQGFLGYFIEKDCLSKVSPELGRFRSYVMATLENYLRQERRFAGAQKRGAHLDFVQAETDLAATATDPEQAFFKGWAVTLLERAMTWLREEVGEEEMALLAGAIPPGMSVSERKNRRYQLRIRLRGYLREHLQPGAGGKEKDIDSEIREILSILS